MAASGGLDPALLRLIKGAKPKAVLRELAKLPSEDYCEPHDVKVWVGTLNANARSPPPGSSLDDWLRGARHADVAVVGLQEVVPLSASSVVLASGCAEAAAAWDRLIRASLNPGGPPAAAPAAAAAPAPAEAASVEQAQGEADGAAPEQAGAAAEGSAAAAGEAAEALEGLELTAEGSAAEPSAGSSSGGGSSSSAAEEEETLRQQPGGMQGDRDDFVQVAGRQLVGIYITAWVRRSMLPHVRGVQVASVGCGLLGVMGNKGGCAVRMRLFDTGMCFVNVHLSSGENPGDEQRRISDYVEIMRRLAFKEETPAAAAAAPGGSPGGLAAAGSASPPAGGSSGTRLGVSKVLEEVGQEGQWGSMQRILEAEHCFLLGDLNMRLRDVSDAQARAAIQEGELESLLERDQLLGAMREGKAFVGWGEARITFPPTFKHQNGTRLYLGDALSSGSALGSAPSASSLSEMGEEGASEAGSEQLAVAAAQPGSGPPAASSGSSSGKRPKVRRPAWTDRVLHSSSSAGVAQLTYESCQTLLFSDHRPVSAAFFVRCARFDPERVAAAVEHAWRAVDAAEMAATPHCSLEPKHVEVGAVGYAESHIFQFELTNESAVPAEFELTDLPGAPAPAWVSLHPSAGMVDRGDSIILTAHVCVTGGPGGAAEVVAGSGSLTLDAIIVLRVAGGNDVFLSLTGSYTPSFFGLSLATLARMPRPISSGGTLLAAEEAPPGVPPEVVQLCSFLQRRGRLGTPGLFATDVVTAAMVASSGARHAEAGLAACEGTQLQRTQAAVEAIRQQLDGGEAPGADTHPCHVAAALIAFLAAMPAPLFPPAVQAICDVADPKASTALALLQEALGPAELELYALVMDLLQEALGPEYTSTSGLSPRSLAAVLAEALFPPVRRTVWGSPRRPTSGGKGAAGAAAKGAASAGPNEEQVVATSSRRAALVEELLRQRQQQQQQQEQKEEEAVGAAAAVGAGERGQAVAAASNSSGQEEPAS